MTTPRTRGVFRCKTCHTVWRQWYDGTFSLYDSKQEPLRCCDNANYPPLVEIVEPEAAAKPKRARRKR